MNKNKYLMLFSVSLILTIMFFGLTLGLALRPYSTILPYQGKFNDEMVKGFLEDGQLVLKMKGIDDIVVKYDYIDAHKDDVNAFELKPIHVIIKGTSCSLPMKNIGNFVCVFLFAFFTLFGIGSSTYLGLKAFAKQNE